MADDERLTAAAAEMKPGEVRYVVIDDETGAVRDAEPYRDFIFLEGGTLDLGIIRDSRGWSALRWVLIRPWRWARIPRILRDWPRKNEPDPFAAFRESFGKNAGEGPVSADAPSAGDSP